MKNGKYRETETWPHCDNKDQAVKDNKGMDMLSEDHIIIPTQGTTLNFSFHMRQSCERMPGEALLAHPHDAAKALPLEHQVKGRVDLWERHAVRDEFLQLQLLQEIIRSINEQFVRTMNTSVFWTFLYLQIAVSSIFGYLLHVHSDPKLQISTNQYCKIWTC